MLALGAGSDAEAARHRCAAFSFEHNGVPWHAKRIRTANVSCSAARKLIKAYARPRNCQFRAPCDVHGYVCRTTEADGSTFRETCRKDRKTVRWRGSYTSS
jgi:hypothetical protein